MAENIVTEQAVPAKLIINDKELDAVVVGHSYEENEIRQGYLDRLVRKDCTEIFTCVREFSKYY